MEPKAVTNVPLPDSSELTKEDFIHSEWKDILGNSPMDRYHKAERKFSDAASDSRAEGNLPRAKVFQLLANACAMDLTNKSQDEPFEPSITGWGMSTATLDWFSESDINFLAESIDEIEDPMLRGRLADMLWLRMKPKNHRCALEAIDNYRSLDLNNESWVKDIGDCWKRALILSLKLGAGAENRAGEMEKELLNALDSATTEDLYFGHWIATTLLELKLGRNEEANIARKLKDLGERFESKNRFREARNHHELARIWFRKSGDKEKQVDMQVAVAEGWAKEAERAMSSHNPSAIAALGYYDNAIQAYQNISNAEREPRMINQRIDVLQQLYKEACQKAPREMRAISLPETGISEVTEMVKREISGKGPIEALHRLANLVTMNARETREEAIKSLAEHPWMMMAHHTILTEDNRPAAKNSGIRPGGNEEENEPAIWGRIMMTYENKINWLVPAAILPALSVMHKEHDIDEDEFTAIASSSPAVQPEREQLLGKALFYGYEGEFATSIHILAPQVENIIRFKLNEVGVNTTNNIQGILDEKGLGPLIDAPEFEQIFGEDLSFEIRALFYDHAGPNLRNNVAHGLLTFQQCQSVESAYAWWLALKIVLRDDWPT